MLKNSIITLIDKPEVDFGLKQYDIIKEEYLRNIPLNQNVVFIVIFDYFYHLSDERKPFKGFAQKDRFFTLFDTYRRDVLNGNAVQFERIIREVSNISGKCEGVFASKIYHTLYNDKPILDSILAKHFSIKIRDDYRCKTFDERINYFIEAYNNYCTLFFDYLDSNEASQIIAEFNTKFPNNDITDTKIIDFILWADR